MGACCDVSDRGRSSVLKLFCGKAAGCDPPAGKTEVKHMKSKRVRLILIVCAAIVLLAGLSWYMVFVRGFYAESDKVVGEYTGNAKVAVFENDEAWKIGANKYGQPVFADPKKAFRLAQERFADAIKLIPPGKLTERNYQVFKQLGWQIQTDDEALSKLGFQLSQFLDIYENSFMRWIYVPGLGWERSCP